MQIFVHAQARHVVDVSETASVSDVLASVASLEHMAADSLYLTCGGRPVESGSLLDNGVLAMSTLEVGVRMLGGTS